MKVKTSVTLSEDLVKEIDRLAGERRNRSAFIEKALRCAVRQARRGRREVHDLEILNRNAAALKKEAEDVLDYQAPL